MFFLENLAQFKILLYLCTKIREKYEYDRRVTEAQ